MDNLFVNIQKDIGIIIFPKKKIFCTISKYDTKTSFFEALCFWSKCFKGHVESNFDKPVERMSKQSREFFNERDREKI